MSRKIILSKKDAAGNTYSGELTYNREYSEYKVRFLLNGVYQKNADYFTECKQDAEGTFNAWVKQRSEGFAHA
jgi:hypothetical protein